MNRIFYLCYLLCGLPLLVRAQDSNQNYIKTLVYRDSTTGTTARGAVTYYDGLGRPIQQVAGKMATSGKDMITHIAYDAYGRQSKQYLPYPSTGSELGYDGAAAGNVLQYYSSSSSGSPNLYPQETTGNPYSEQFFEASPLSRVLKQAEPGNAWIGNATNDNDHTVKFAYQTNGSNEVKKLRAVATWNASTMVYDIAFISDGYYAINQLYKTVTKNENWISGVANTTEEFKNKQGQIVLKKNYNGTTAHETYYVYDQFGNLTYVLPPLCNGSNIYIDNLGYQYKYDTRNRIVEKKLPGKQWEYIVYNTNDKPVLTGPVISPFGGGTNVGAEVGWLMTIYDRYGRVAVTGWYPATANTTNRKAAQSDQVIFTMIASRTSPTSIDTFSVGYGLTVNGSNTSPPSGFKLLTANYYDDYTWPGAPAIPASTQVESQNIRSKAKGLPTGGWTRVLTSLTGTERQLSYILYDRRGRAVRNYSANYLGGYVQVDTKLAFDSKPIYTKTKHKRLSSSTEISVQENFTYDAQDRVKYRTHSINSAAGQTLSDNTYNELGQLITKKVGNYTPSSSSPAISVMQTIDYKYNIRGWLTGINDVNTLGSDLFAYKIAYNNVTDQSNGALSIPALYNGNITETYWRSASDNTLRKYSYKYDDLNRLTFSYYQKPGTTVPYTGSYNENPKYDMHGNIIQMLRTGGVDDPTTQVTIDNLIYTYAPNSNRLTKVVDNSNSPQGFKDVNTSNNTEYTYDDNGNMLTDINKGITGIKYNHMNLPTEITIGSNKIVYLYDAAGTRLKKTVTENGNTVYVDYLNGFQYKGGVLQFFPTAEGYVDNTVNSSGNNVYNYVYQYKDHLGNVRVNFATVAGKNGAQSVGIKEENHYYAFGLKHLNYNMDYLEYQEIEGDIVLYPPISATGKLANNYKYNGKELQDELGLGIYDYGARNYDPALGRWFNIDPLAEKSRRFSPYVYALNNPVFFIDPDGMMAIWKPNKDGSLTAEKGDNTATLAKFLGTTASDVGTRFKINGKSIGTNHQFKEGEKVKLDNNVTRAIARSKGGSVDEINSGKAKFDVKNDNYICDECAQMAANGEEITPANATKYDQFPNPMKMDSTPGFTQVDNFDNVKFNEGIASIGGQHTVSFYGKSNDGTVYVTTKDGREAKPQVLSLSEVIKAFNADQGTNFTMKDVKYYKKDEDK